MSQTSAMRVVTTTLDVLVETLNTTEPRLNKAAEISVWYSHNDGCWKWSVLTPPPAR